MSLECKQHMWQRVFVLTNWGCWHVRVVLCLRSSKINVMNHIMYTPTLTIHGIVAASACG